MRLPRIKWLPSLLLPLLVLLSAYAEAKNIIHWPLNLPKSLSATLGEIRGYSLHQGIDIKTRGRVGYPVFAALSGKLYRIVSKEYGYGNALFIDHGNGLKSVYGHLDSFEEGKHHLDSLAKTLSVLYNRDFLDFRLYKSHLPYNSEEMIAYAGESGSGPPHLHFEIRKDDRLLNPLALIHIKDKEPPIIENLFVCIEKNDTTIKEERFRIKKRWGKYLPQNGEIEVSSNDRIFFKLSCYDRVGARNRVAIYKIKLFSDKARIFETAFNAIQISDYKNGHLIYDISKSAIGDGGVSYTYSLCQRDKRNSSFINGDGSGYIEPKNGERDIRIEVLDFAGNAAIMKFKLLQKRIGEKIASDFYVIDEKRICHIRNMTGEMEVIMPSGSIKGKRLLKVEISEKRGLLNKIKKISAVNREDILKIFSIYPFDIVYKRPITIQIQKPKGISDREVQNILIYRFFESRRPKPLDTVYNSERGVFKTLSLTNGYFILIRDRIPPRMVMPPTHEFCEDRSIYSRIRLYASDNLSRIDRDSITCLIDGESFPSKYDTARKWIEMNLPREAISIGLHHIFVEVSDRAGNQCVFRELFMRN
ncbi:MAG: M23 family metallopeptidase [Spirochaetota bacterium]|nr:M23 family metallopeptidase [Spirochaetota bacterium]